MHDVILQLISLRPKVPNQHLLIDGNVLRLSGRRPPSLKVCKPDAKDKRPWKACYVCSVKEKQNAKGDYLKTTYVCLCSPSEPGLHPEKCFKDHDTKLDHFI